MSEDAATDGQIAYVRPVRGRRAFEEILLQLEEAIGAGHLSAGDRLPPERELASRFQVSRTSVREALRVLETLGIVSVRRGAENGATLREEPGNALTQLLRFHLALRHIGVEDLVEFRIVVETWAAAECARRQDPAILAELGEIVDRMTTAKQPTFNELDAAFHLELVRAAGNELAALVADGSRTAIRRTMLDAILAVRDWEPQRARLVREHRKILAAIAAGDADEAARSVDAHIRGFWARHLRRRAPVQV
jgi:GntR family transcriptional repressor for pyruvate dehydrogenase complex